MEYKDYDIIITNEAQKAYILKEVSKEKNILTTKIMTLKEFKDNYYGKVKLSALSHVIKEFDYSVDTASVVLENAYFIKEVWNYLNKHNLIFYNEYFKDSFKKILLIDVEIDQYLKNDLKDISITCLKNEKKFIPLIYEFNSLEEEIVYVASKIKKLIKNVDINKIKLVNVTLDMVYPVKRIFSMMGINIDVTEKRSIYALKEVRTFINDLNKDNYQERIDSITNEDIKNTIINLINDYQLSSFSETDLDILKYLLARKSEKKNKYVNTVKCIEIEDIVPDDSYYFIIGLNDGILPKIVKDEDYFSDQEKESFGIITSKEKNIFNKKLLLEKITSIPNTVCSYHLKSYLNSYEPSYFLKENNFEIIKNPISEDLLSTKMNKIIYTRKMDDYLKNNHESEDLINYYKTYGDSEYNSYDNSFKGIKKESLREFLNNKLLLSYSSVDNFFHCAFKYYIQNILKLEPIEETRALLIGNCFHYVLSQIYEDGFDFDKTYDNYLNDKELAFDDEFFMHKLKKDLEFIIQVIKEQDSQSSLNKSLTEKRIYVDLDSDIKVTFMGVIDKIKYNNQIMAIIDYKTGNLETSIDNINYGFHLQLPIYIWIAKKEFKNISLAGFYLQKILNPETVDEDIEDKKNKLKLEGFSNSNMDIIKEFDSTYESSEVIKSLRTTKSGWSSYSKVLNEEEINRIEEITTKIINDAKESILNADFKINPKRIDGDLEGCRYCKFHDLCYLKEEDIVDLKYQSISDILKGGDNNEMD